MSRPLILWFRQDLRLHDNPALQAALTDASRIIPIYIHDDTTAWVAGAASRWWLHHSLTALADKLKQLGSRLIIRDGQSTEVLQQLINETGADTVYCNRVYEPAGLKRDKQLRRQLNENGITFSVYQGNLLREPDTVRNLSGQPYKVFTPFYKCYLREGWDNHVYPAPKQLPGVATRIKSKKIADLDLLPTIGWDSGFNDHWQPGEAGAWKRLSRFLRNDLADYHQARDVPSQQGTSRLSPHLHFGEISVRAILGELDRQDRRRQGTSFIRELIWRDFAYSVLFHFPHTTDKPFDQRFNHVKWKTSKKLLQAWQQGRTGYPLVDAGMRELWQTGYMHNRVRMIVASFLTKNGMVHWKKGAEWFWDTLVDADLAANSMNWQWVAGCGVDAAPYFRIFNPVTQSQKFDKNGLYIRRWVPELAKLPNKYIHEPWKAPEEVQQQAECIIGKDYPEPIIDLKATREAALEIYKKQITGK
ncbi:cryptochrome/photolyase family protein [Thiohalophilus thiocyanatoxydans]|uniref:Deoxyribodipyrimidine photo-lyase n=1 Tax=Thiohalophilus thiocyanatoxydans TaxID=381308 RepID=A0A4R8IJM1_9GAMM|nr:deoxyribodipyrimidine photo-lyase [Thiohalophilus thiocyanatoxydans]TDY00921.1 deoxyribodipyrimidine photo-lyase [Thiohalophilus thiocyanatoxydans]